eukprot:394071_1
MSGSLFAEMNISIPYNVSFSDDTKSNVPGIQKQTIHRIGKEEMKFILDHGADAIINKFKKYGYKDDQKENKENDDEKLWKKEDLQCGFEGDDNLKVSLTFQSFVPVEDELDVYFENDLKILEQSVKCTGTIIKREGEDNGELEVHILGFQSIMPEIRKRIAEKIKSEMNEKGKQCNVKLTAKNKIIVIEATVI